MATLRRLLVLVLLLGLVLVSGSPLTPPVAAQTPTPPTADAPVRLPGHTLAALPKATKVARSAQSPSSEQPLTLTVVLTRSDEAGFQRFLADVENPKSAAHGQFLSQAEVTKRFGPSQQAYDATLAYLQQQGFVLVEGSANRLTLTVKGTRGQAEKAFAIQMNDYQLGSRSFYANDQDPAVPGSIAKNVQAVTGLSNLAQPQPNIQAIHGLRGCATPAGQLPKTVVELSCSILLGFAVLLYALGCLSSNIVLKWCNPLTPVAPSLSGRNASAAPVLGAGQKIGLLEYDTFSTADVSAYLNLVGAPATLINQLSTVAVNGGVASPGPGEAETLLDIDTVMGIAPAANVVVYDAPGTTSFQSLFNTMVNDGDTVISNSWSYCEDQTSLADAQSIDAIFANGAASGVSVFNASGDSGSACLDGSPNTISVPADAPHGTAVGGTTATLGPGDTYGGETWWNGSAASPPTGQGGFGVSRFFPRPAYQDGLTTAANRSVPDVVVDADPASGISICQADAGGCPDGLLHGGTSLAAPEWAAMGALLNQSQGHNLGTLNPLLYPHANTTSFHTPASMGSDFAHVGLGSPRFDLIDVALGGVTVGLGNGARSGVATVPNDTVAADGMSTAAIRVMLVDANGHLLSGKNVSLAKSAGSHATITPASGPSNIDNGTMVFTVKDSTIEDVTFTATDTTDGVPIQQTALVHFVSPAAAAGNIVANPTTVPADGTTASTLTVTLHDANGQGVSGKSVTLSQGSGHSIVTGPAPATTDSNGQVTFAATDTTTESVTYTAVDATDGNLPVPGSAAVSFTSGTSSCNNGTATAAAGYAFTPFATGFAANGPGICGGPTGLTFDSAGNLYVVDDKSGFLYKFGLQGGIADAATQVNTTPFAFPEGLIFGKDGKLYMTRINVGDVVELNPTTGAIIRTVATGFSLPLGLATDPLSGDLFVTQATSANIMRIANPASATPTVAIYASPGASDGITAAPDGTFFVATFATNSVTGIAGTNTPAPGMVTVIAPVPKLDGIAVATNGGVAAFLFVNRNDGIITKVDLTTTPPTLSDIFSGGSRGDFAAVGPDGCYYATQNDSVIKVTNADGTCPFAPTSVLPQLSLSPAAVLPNPPTGSPLTFTATLRNLPAPAGTTVTFTVSGANPQTKLVPADTNGVATFTYTGAFTGADTLTATATVGTTALTANPVAVTWVAGKDVSFLSLNLSATSGKANVATTLTASLSDVSKTPPTPIGGAAVTISLGSQSCQATTGADGNASCSLTPTGTLGRSPLAARYAGTSQYTASTATASFSLGNPSGLQFYPLAKPVRLLDTRAGATAFVHPNASLTAGQTLALPGQFSYQGVTIPNTAQAIVGNATVANGSNGTPAGFATIFPSGVPLPLTSNLNFVPGTVRPNNFTVALGSDTKFNLYSSSGGDFVIDLSGYYAPVGAGGLYFHPLSAPVRELDTRSGAAAFVHPNATLTAGQTLTLPGPFTFNSITVPAGAKALVGNATVANNANGTPAGFATLYPDDVPLPLASTLNFVPGTVAPNAFTVALGGGDGGYDLYTSSGGDFVIDITGYLDTTATGGLLFTPLAAPVRELDTRSGASAFVHPNATLTAGQTLTLPGSFTFNSITVPASAKALVGNATVANDGNSTPAGFATLYPGGVPLPLASNLNFVAKQVAPNAVVVGVGGDGSYNLYTSSGGDFVIDISGYFS